MQAAAQANGMGARTSSTPRYPMGAIGRAGADPMMPRAHFGADGRVAMQPLSGHLVGRKGKTQSRFSSDKAKIADVVELPITVVNNVLYQPLRQQFNQQLQNQANKAR